MAPLARILGTRAVTISVIDGPIDFTHPCFLGAAVTVAHSDNPPGGVSCQATLHGTHVASIIFGQSRSSVEGIAPGCRGISFPVFRASREAIGCSQTELARAILLSLELSADIINISGGQLDFSKEPEQFLQEALTRCEEHGVLVVAAAGNDGCDCPHTPASCPTVLSVGAADEAGRPLPLSNWNASYRENGLLAPGRGILGAAPGGGVARRSGTSFAAPIVSASAALLICEQIARGERRDALAVRAALLASATHCPAGQSDRSRDTAGALNIAGASHLLKQGRETMIASDIHPESPQLDAVLGVVAGNAREPALQTAEYGSPSLPPLPTERRIEAACGSDGSCSCKGEPKDLGGPSAQPAGLPATQIVYALGNVGYDFGTESRRDSMLQYFLKSNEAFTEKKLVAYLLDAEKSAGEVERLIWTLKIDGTPVYAIRPVGAFAYAGYAKLLKLLSGQLDGKIALVAVPGIAAGRTLLLSGESVPTLHPVVKGMIPWDVAQVVGAALVSADTEPRLRAEQFLREYTDMVSRKFRNLGVMGRDRALNFASMSAGRVLEIVDRTGGLDLVLDDIEVSRSAACRTGSECYDVRVKLFIPSDVTSAIRVFQFTVDVSDAVPVSIGDVSAWSERPRA